MNFPIFNPRFKTGAVLVWLICLSAFPSAGSDQASDEENWRKADNAIDYPPSYSENFIDSILTVKNAVIAKKRRILDDQPFMREEKLVFQVGWGPLKAGFAIVTSTFDTVKGVALISARAATNSFFSSLYKVRDRVSTTMDSQGVYPFFFEQHIREGRYKADRWEFFDQSRNLVFSHKKNVDSTSIRPFSQNFLSLIYFLRTRTVSPGDSVSIDCFVDTKCYSVVIYCIKKETITVDAGEFNCVLVRPVLVGKGRVFSKKDEIKIWVTDDAYKMPVKMESKITWGSLFAKLIWYSRKE
jgi:Protein of unknown function (DUF3108)